MQQITGVDDIFLTVDASHAAHGVIASLTVYEVPEDDPEAGGVVRMRQRIAERLDALPPLRRVITSVPVGINNSYLHESETPPDLNHHVREMRVPAPGGPREVASVVAAASEVRLPTDIPPWEFLVLTGLEDGKIAHVFRVHHGCMDGGTMQIVYDLLSDSPKIKARPLDAPPAEKSPVPVKVEVLGRGLLNNVLMPAKMMTLGAKAGGFFKERTKEEGILALPAFMARMTPGEIGKPLASALDKVQRRRGKPGVRQLIPRVMPPKTSINGTVTSRRSVAYADHALADFKDVSKAMGVTLNDVVVTVCAGALRGYLQNHGGVPDKPLVLSVPVTIRTGDEEEFWANYASGFWADLPTNLIDPLERLKVVHHDLTEGKQTFDSLPKNLIRDSSKVMWPQSMIKLFYRAGDFTPDWANGLWNIIISNVKGPTQPMYLTGAKMVGYWPLGFLIPGGGLTVVLQSYLDRLCFGFLACPDLVTDVWELTEHMEIALEELKAAVAEHNKTA